MRKKRRGEKTPGSGQQFKSRKKEVVFPGKSESGTKQSRPAKKGEGVREFGGKEARIFAKKGT